MRRALVAAAASIDPDLPLFQVRTMPERLRASLAVERLLAWLLCAFAALAVFLAAAGLYAVVSYTTTLRTREFGDPRGARRDGAGICGSSCWDRRCGWWGSGWRWA